MFTFWQILFFPVQSLFVSFSRIAILSHTRHCHQERNFTHACVWGLNTTVNNYSTIRASVSAHPSDLQYMFTVSPHVKTRQGLPFLLKLEHIEKVTLIT